MHSQPVNRTERFLSGLGLGYLFQGLSMIVGVALTPFMLRHLGQHDYGLWLASFQILNYLMLIDFGVVMLLPREIAYATGRASGVQQASDLPQSLGQAARLKLYQTPLVALAAGLCWLFMPPAWREFQGPIGVLLLAFAVTFPFRLCRGALEGLQDLGFVGRVHILTWLVGLIVNVALVLAGWGLYALAAGWIVTQVAAGGLYAFRLWSHFPSVLPRRLPRLATGALKQYLTRGFWVTVNQTAGSLLWGSDLLLIGNLLGPSAVIPYTCTGKLASALSNQPQLLMEAAIPGLSEIRTGATRDRQLHVSQALSQGMLLLSGAVACVVLAVNEGFVSWWVGSQFYGGLVLTTAFVLNMVLRHLNLTLAYANFCFGHERRIAVTALVDGLITVGSAYFLIGRLGLIGALTGSILGVCLVGLPVNARTTCREGGLGFWALLSPLGPWLVRFVLLAAGMLTVATQWTPRGPALLAAAGLACGLLYVGVMVRPMLQSALGPYLKSSVARFLRRRGGKAEEFEVGA